MMCSLFGLIDYQNALTTRQKNHILQVLGKECEVRGTDATGIAYNFGGSIKVFKRPLAAHKLKFHVPNGVPVVMGHTRLATQGKPADNFNNHPWSTGTFALAHNGVLWNDRELRQTENLPDTRIQTDSYVAVQLLEQQKTLDFTTISMMAEKIQGSFVFTVLDRDDNLYFVRGDNPLAIFDFGGFYLYASTEEILRRAMRKLRLHHRETVRTEEGDILKIDRTGQRSFGHFTPSHSFEHFWRNPRFRMLSWFDEVDEPEAIDGQPALLIQTAKSMGVSEDEVLALLDLGYDPCEIEELLYNPALLHEAAAELLCAYY